MKALSIPQPWATLVALAEKHHLTRPDSTDYRGPLVIHASAGPGPGEVDLALTLEHPVADKLLSHHELTAFMIPYGALIAVAELTDCVPAASLRKLSDQERALGDFREGRHAWRLEAVQPLLFPVPCLGGAGLWDLTGDLAKQVSVLQQQAAGRRGEVDAAVRRRSRHALLVRRLRALDWERLPLEVLEQLWGVLGPDSDSGG